MGTKAPRLHPDMGAGTGDTGSQAHGAGHTVGISAQWNGKLFSRGGAGCALPTVGACPRWCVRWGWLRAPRGGGLPAVVCQVGLAARSPRCGLARGGVTGTPGTGSLVPGALPEAVARAGAT